MFYKYLIYFKQYKQVLAAEHQDVCKAAVHELTSD